MSTCTSKRTGELVVSVVEGLRNEDSFKIPSTLSLTMTAPLILFNNQGCREKEKHHNNQYCITSMAIKAQHRLTIHLQLKIDTVKVNFEAVDNMLSAIRERFKQPSFEAYENMESLIVKTIASEDAPKETSYLDANYGTEININQFSTVEADILPTIFRESKHDCFRDILDEVESLKIFLAP